MSATSTPSRCSKRRHSLSINNELLCPVCFDLIQEAHITKCGHTFCFECITKCIDLHRRCPKCSIPLASMDQVYPNFLLNELVKKHKSKVSEAENLREFIAHGSQSLTLPDVNNMLETLSQRKQLLEAESNVAQNKLLFEFLCSLRKQKEIQLKQITQEMSLVTRDLEAVEGIVKESNEKHKNLTQFLEEAETATGIVKEVVQDPPVISIRKKRMEDHFQDFVESYFTTRARDMLFHSADATKNSDKEENGLHVFKENLVKATRYSGMRCLATLNFSSDIFNNFTIVSSIEFDKDNEFFAISGVTKRIKLFDYGTILADVVDMHYPVIEMTCTSKISCLSWNTYHKNVLSSSDYEGTVTVWDASTGQRTKMFQEHEKRCWSVDFNEVDTRLIASGSDDAKVKLWSLNMNYSVSQIEAKANICCVKFNPKSSCHLAFGSADHCVHYYDLRNTKHALSVFKGHRKAVSYVKFLNMEDIVSASTDSHLKLWNVKKPNCLRSYVGHVNEKNFVGLATDGEYIACGSENNALYIYYRGLSKPIHAYKFSTHQNDTERKEDDVNEFVSAVCWRRSSRTLVAANSQGIIRVLELE